MCFFWQPVHRQIRVVGRVEKTSREESAAYFAGRPLKSQVGAWISKQSRVIPSGTRRELEEEEERFLKQLGEEKKVDVPDFWGGYRIIPDEIEFWVGQPGRLHDRFRYLRTEGKDEWKIERLSP
jgi:pyridoxamine 5'-phosphate oxidase